MVGSAGSISAAGATVTAGSGGAATAGNGSGGSVAGMPSGGTSASGSGGAAAGAPGTAGTGVGAGGSSPNVKGGASAAAICPMGMTYGNPLEGMSSVTSISAPTTGDVTYFAFIEGPMWVASLGKLFFSDIASSPEERIWVLTPPSTTPEIFLDASGSNGLALDSEDQLVYADQRNRRLARVDPASTAPVPMEYLPGDGTYKPNDLILRSDGNIYFTDPQSGLYRVSPSRVLSPVIKDVRAPNGVVLSPDETKLYVGDVQNRSITVFTLAADGAIMGSGTLFTETVGRTVDGMAVDCAGNVYAGTGTGVEVFSPASEALGTIPTGESSNATFGGMDRKTLYVTSRSVLKAVTLAVPGLPN